MRMPVHFDGPPDLFSRSKALLSPTSRLRVRYPTPDTQHHRLRRDAKGRPILAGWIALLRKVA